MNGRTAKLLRKVRVPKRAWLSLTRPQRRRERTRLTGVLRTIKENVRLAAEQAERERAAAARKAAEPAAPLKPEKKAKPRKRTPKKTTTYDSESGKIGLS